MTDRQLAALVVIYLFLLPGLGWLAWSSVHGYDGRGPCFVAFPDKGCAL